MNKIKFDNIRIYCNIQNLYTFTKYSGYDPDQNDKCGFIKFGSRIDILLPENAELLVEIGDRVVGTLTPIARIGDFGVEDADDNTLNE